MDRKEENIFPFKSDFVTHKFKKYLIASGLKNCESLNVHSLRHTFASHLVMAGVDLYSVSKLLGHSSVKITETYAHLLPDHLKKPINLLHY
jgi:site-specific recombinase XerD